jgi:hypothetical protein
MSVIGELANAAATYADRGELGGDIYGVDQDQADDDE